MPIEQLDGVSIVAVQERVKCEIGQAFFTLQGKQGYPDLSKWAAGMTLYQISYGLTLGIFCGL
jgi:hypothetical protein